MGVSKGRRLMKVWSEYKINYLLLIPGIVWIFLFSYYPMIGNVIAFQDYKLGRGFFGSPWVGLKWFRTFIQTPGFWDALRNTLILNVYSICTVFPASILFAILLNEVRSRRYKKGVQMITYMPHFLSWATVGSLLFIILNPYTGLVNQVMLFLGLDRYSFLTENAAVRTVMISSQIWKEIGWNSIIYLATLSSINPELYESASLDGANKWQQMRNITLPSMAFIISYNLVFKLSSMLGSSFEMSYTIVNAATYRNGSNLALFIYNFGLQKTQYSFGQAMELSQSVAAFILLLIANKAVKMTGNDGVF